MPTLSSAGSTPKIFSAERCRSTPVLRGAPSQKAFSAFCYKAGQLVGIESVNRAGDHMFGRRLLPMDRSIEPEQAADHSFDLKRALA